MIDAIVAAAGGYEKVSDYTKSISEFGKLSMVAGVIGVVASPILGTNLEIGVGVAALGFATWKIFKQVSKDFHAVDVMVKKHFAAHQEWLERERLANLGTVQLAKL